MRALPHEFGENVRKCLLLASCHILKCLAILLWTFDLQSSYAWFPLQTPESMKGFLAKLGQEHRYNFSRPGDPPVVGLVNEYRDVEKVLKSQNFKQPYAKIVTGIIKNNGSVLPFSFFLFSSSRMNEMVQAVYMSRVTRFFIASGDPARGERDQREVLQVLTAEEGSTNTIAMSFYQTTKAVIDEKSFTLSDKRIKNVDIVDALRFIPIRWVATEIVSSQLFFSSSAWMSSLQMDADGDCNAGWLHVEDSASVRALHGGPVVRYVDRHLHVSFVLILSILHCD